MESGRTGALTPEGIRALAREHEPRHRRLMTSSEDGRRLSGLMAPSYRLLTLAGHGLLTTTGRRSGQPRETVIRAILRGDTAYVVMLRPPALAIAKPEVISAWLWNARADPNVTLRLGRRTHRGRAREIADEAELAIAERTICDGVHLVDYGECLIHLRGLPTPAKIRDLHRYWFETGIPVAIDLDDGAAGT